MKNCIASRKDAKVAVTGVAAKAHAGRVAAKGVSRTGTKRRGKYDHEALRGHEFNVAGNLMAKERVIDRKGDLYTERVVNLDTGEIVRDIHEPLSRHIGRGSAKHPRPHRKKT